LLVSSEPLFCIEEEGKAGGKTASISGKCKQSGTITEIKRVRIGTKCWQVCVLPGEHPAQSKSI